MKFKRKKSEEFDGMADEDEEPPEEVRVDSWMQSMVPSLPKRAAIVCLVFNIFVPGLGTFTGGILSCCMGRPRYDFHPARLRCPTAFLVMSIGVAQFLCIAFFLVGWLWSIMWGFLMLNLSDPKFRVLPAPPQPKPPPGSMMRPTVKVVKPAKEAEEMSVGKKNFGRLIQKVQENKDQALGLAPPTISASMSSSLSTSPSSSSSEALKKTEDVPPKKSASLLSGIPFISCASGAPIGSFVANVRSKFSKLLSPSSRSVSQSSLLSNQQQHPLESVTTEKPEGGGGGQKISAGNWKRAAVTPSSKPAPEAPTEPPTSPALSNGGVSSSNPASENNNTFNGIVSVTPATPVHSSDTSSFIVDSDSTSMTEEITVDCHPPPFASELKELATETMKTTKEDVKKSEPAVQPVQLEAITTTVEDAKSMQPLQLEVSTSLQAGFTDIASGAKSDVVESPLATDDEKKDYQTIVLPNTPDVTIDVPPTSSKKVGPISSKGFTATDAAKMNPTKASEMMSSLEKHKQLRPKMKQTMTYHFDA